MKTITNLTILLVFLSFTLAKAQAPEYGTAIYYADYFQGKRTASGENYDKYGLTCAHKVHPFGTQLKVTRMDNFKSVMVRVNDRGPYNPGCIIDLSWAAADQIGLLLDGKAEVKVEVVGYSSGATYTDQPIAASQQTVKTVKEEEKKFSLPLPPKPVTFTNAFPETTTANQTAKDPSAGSVPDSYNMANVPSSYNAPSAPINAPASSGIARVPSGQQGYTVQVGSYSQYSNADRQAKMIMGKGIDQVYVKESKKSDGTSLYKILIHTFSNKTDAVNYLSTLKHKHGLSGFVINLANI
ncbi:MAG: septal ring lytic transglycosylase RlpA family protein [Saprospirales bacterium]|nr:septal ring lytic transglycosylase RlpA family protein [Saprospirales bacterium]MBK8490184.1 septal ring lytic transglycosylase RlpA family protein [Saprospirales bacterium]